MLRSVVFFRARHAVASDGKLAVTSLHVPLRLPIFIFAFWLFILFAFFWPSLLWQQG